MSSPKTVAFNMEEKKDLKPKIKFKDFDETFPVCAFSLAFGFLYPSPSNMRRRFILITAIVIFNGGQLFWFISYTIKCLILLDIYNFSRNMTLAVVLILFFIKTYYVISATVDFDKLVRWMSSDLLRANDLPEDYQKIYLDYIWQGTFGEWLWLLVPTVMGTFFPLYAGIQMSIESIQRDDFTRKMVHDMDMLYAEHLQNDWPFFHCYFAYNCCQCVVLVPNFCGFDGSFCIAATHLRLKLKLMIHRLQEAYSVPRSHRELKARVSEVIEEHQDALSYYQTLQTVYEPWLFSVFLLSAFLISFNLYQIYLLKSLEPKYTMFCVFGVCHILMPCYYAAMLTEEADAVSDEIYCVSWERSPHLNISRLLIFMIARAQTPIIITGWIVVFNMELFKSICQTSYSFLTLITA